jgi:hypothetical protein
MEGVRRTFMERGDGVCLRVDEVRPPELETRARRRYQALWMVR